MSVGDATALVVLLGVLVDAASAVRSTWSPCGLSMLATITPLAERGRGHRFGSTAAWFVVGSVAGGATLGAVIAGLAAAVRAIGPGPGTTVTVALGAAVVAALSDARVAGFRLPSHGRQVNERWLDGYRPWVYGAGFGWQIGCGMATYLVTAGVYLLVVLGALSALPLVGLVLGTLFGLVRGLAVLLGRRVTAPDALHALHRTLSRLGPWSARAMVAVEVVAAGVSAVWLMAAVWGRADSRWTGPVGVLVATVLGLAIAAAALGWWARPLHRRPADPAPALARTDRTGG
jgi:hypothetical protein